MKNKQIISLGCLLVFGLWLSGCVTTAPKESRLQLGSEGKMIYGDEFEFAMPPSGWRLVEVESGGEFGFGFLKTDPGSFPSQSMFVYDEEPFGCSLNFEDREEEFVSRFLWSSPMSINLKSTQKQKVRVVGGEGLAVTIEGQDPIRKEKAKSKVVFGKRGNRVVAWYITQWRPIDGTFDQSAFDVFDKWWSSYRYLKKSFYESL